MQSAEGYCQDKQINKTNEILSVQNVSIYLAQQGIWSYNTCQIFYKTNKTDYPNISYLQQFFSQKSFDNSKDTIAPNNKQRTG